jgi:hypothetical protein
MHVMSGGANLAVTTSYSPVSRLLDGQNQASHSLEKARLATEIGRSSDRTVSDMIVLSPAGNSSRAISTRIQAISLNTSARDASSIPSLSLIGPSPL